MTPGALAGRPNATLKLYPDPNRLFMIGQGKATPTAHTAQTGHVARAVDEDLAHWIITPARR